MIAKLEPGGAQLSAFRLSVALRALKIDTVLIAGYATPAGLALAREHGLPCESFTADVDLQWTPDAEFAAWLERRLASAELVHAHMFGAWWAAAQVLDPGRPLVASEHNAYTWPGPDHDDAFRAALARVDRFFAHGAAAREYVRERGLDGARLLAGRSAVTGADSRPLPDLPPGRVVFTGRLAPDKGPDLLVEAFGRMDAPPPLVMVGEGRMRAALERRAAALGLDARFTGWQREPGRWIAGAAALAVPSRADAWSQSAVLAMALGTPVVGTAVDALPDVLGGGRGVLVPPEDPDALGGAVRDLVEGRVAPDLDAARAYAAQFTPKRVARTYAAVYRELMAGARWTAFTRETSSRSSGS